MKPSHASVSTSPRARLALRAAEVGIIVAAAAIRIRAAQDEFWLDEILSLFFIASRASSALDILTKYHIDNNHYLSTLWMYWCGVQDSSLVYRLPSAVAGIGTVALAAWISRQWGEVPAFAASLLTASSYILIVYASEARGYAMAGCFALAGLSALQRYAVTRSLGSNAAFCLTACLGFLSHLTFIHFYLGALVWSVVNFAKTSGSWWRAILDMVRCHAAPLAGCVVLYLVDLRYMKMWGGPPYSLQDVISDTLNLTVGAPDSDLANVLPGLLGACAAIAALFCMWRERNNLWIFFATTVFLSPLLLLTLRRPEVLFVRYFYINILFFLVLLSYFLGWLYRYGVGGRLASLGALGLIAFGNLHNAFDFICVGRGQYREAIAYMAERSTEPAIQVSSDHDFRNRAVLEFYKKDLPKDRRLEYQMEFSRSDSIPEWRLLHGQARRYKPQKTILDPRGNRYRLVKVFPYAGLSGWHWALYRKISVLPDSEPGQR